MTTDVTSAVAGSRPYHHGRLRETLLAVAGDLLEEHGPAELSLREAAQRAGVSKAAPYRHFATRDALLDALADEGFTELLRRVQEAAGEGVDTRARLVRVALAYLDFGRRHPARLQLMFGRPALLGAGTPGSDALTGLARLVEEGQRRGDLAPGDPLERARILFALMHGATVLVLGGRLPDDVAGGDAAQDLLETAVLALLDGMRPRPGNSEPLKHTTTRQPHEGPGGDKQNEDVDASVLLDGTGDVS